MADSSRETQPLLPAAAGSESQVRHHHRRRRALYALIAFLFVAISIGLLMVLVKPDGKHSRHDRSLSRRLETSAIFSHLEELYAIAKKHNNSRSVTNGYMASAEYVQGLLLAQASGFCDIETQEFKVPVWAELEVPELSSRGVGKGHWIHYQNKVDFQNFRNSGPSTRLLKQRVAGVEDYGCNPDDLKHVRGKVAVIEEGGPCELWDVAHHAEKAGAKAVLFYNSPGRRNLLWSRIRIVAWKEGDPQMQIPVLSITNSLGLTLIQSQDTAVLNINTVNSQTVESTINVLCTTKGGNEDNTIVLGAHLDSVPEGPGMVDNGSGSMSLLEIALVLARAKYPLENKIVFGWWGAEEIGLLGSRHYVRELIKDKKKKKQVAMNMNFDMLASPNYVPFVHDGRTAPDELVSPSSKIDHLLIEYFDREGQPYEYTDMISGSDFLPFLLEGIPSGGLLTGAGERKTMKQRTLFGGNANSPLDPCYHQRCDTPENVNKHALKLMSQAALYAIAKVAKADNLREWLVNTNVPLH
ncbi:MAG: hypothetical protein J3Q66DRAFT_337194 [Benniella sp.]|nr:MAG: hypothetical protein J3Q66DRAFT_337194 [Benniella sp.]